MRHIYSYTLWLIRYFSGRAAILSQSRKLATVASDIPVKRYGGLKDQDRIFTNVYSRHDHGIKGAKVCTLTRSNSVLTRVGLNRLEETGIERKTFY